jgi:hypothetical protein
VAGGSVTITCQNLDPALAKNLQLVINKLNKVAGNQVDQKAITKELDEIKEIVSRGSVSSQAIQEGVQGGLEKFAQEQRRQFEKSATIPSRSRSPVTQY